MKSSVAQVPAIDPRIARRLEQADVVVLAGGSSQEREVSLTSGAEILRALSVSDGRGPARVRSVEIDAAGMWRWEGQRRDPLAALQALGAVDAYFLAVHGGPGEDGTLQGLLTSVGACYTGSPVRASALCMDKLATRALAQAAGMRVARGACFSPEEVRRDLTRVSVAARAVSPSGWAVKPRCGGSSVLTFVLGPLDDLEGALQAVAETGDDVLVEAALRGVECSCGVLERPGEEPWALPPIEIQPAAGRFFDYQQKYSAQGAREVCPPVSLSAESIAQVQADALRLFELTGCRGYARIDFIVDPEGRPVLLEANTLPGFTDRSLLPQEAAAVGLDYRSLCLWVLASALGGTPGAAP
jgi:D-alanine-D-alanine ligase